MHPISTLQRFPIVYALRSILQRLELSEMFPVSQPLEVELGCGDGSFLVEYARENAAKNFIGTERLLGRIRKLERKAQRNGLSNVRGLRIESAYFLEHLLPANSAAALHIYFPDPWPKRKHARHRLVNERFPTLAKGALEPGGMVFLRTDNEAYLEQMRGEFEASHEFERAETAPELCAIATDFERRFRAHGVPIWHLAYRRR